MNTEAKPALAASSCSANNTEYDMVSQAIAMKRTMRSMALAFREEVSDNLGEFLHVVLVLPGGYRIVRLGDRVPKCKTVQAPDNSVLHGAGVDDDTAGQFRLHKQIAKFLGGLKSIFVGHKERPISPNAKVSHASEKEHP